MPTRRTLGLLLTLGIASVSFSSILARWAQEEHVPSLVISFYRLLFATLMLAPWALRNHIREPLAISRRDLLTLAAIGFFLAAHFATWVTSLEYTSVAASATIVATEALWVPLGTAYLLREHVSVRAWTGVGVAFGGLLLLAYGDRTQTTFGALALYGDFLALAGAMAASLYFLGGRRFRQRMPNLTYATLVYAFAGLFLLGMVLAQGESLAPYSGAGFRFMFLFAFFPMILGHTVFNYLFKWLPPHYISTPILAEPVVSALLAFLLLGETVGALVLAGGAVIIAGILVGTLGLKKLESRTAGPLTE